MSDYLFVTDNVFPLSRDDSARSAWGLARGLLELKHRVTILTLAAGDEAARVPGLARRLRKLRVETPAGAQELGLFEGQFSASDPQLLVFESASASPSERALQLGAAAVSLARDGLVKPEVVVGWAEASVVALARISAAAKLFVLPDTHNKARFSADEASSVGLQAADSPALTAFGVAAAQAVIAPSRKAAKELEATPELAGRPSDEPVIALPFGADEPPFDPSVDKALPLPFSAQDTAARAESRRALCKRLSLSVDPRVVIVGTGPRLEGAGARALIEALPQIVKRNVLLVLPSAGEKALVEKASVFAIENPTKLAMLPEPSDDDLRLLMAASDAWCLLEEDDVTGRAAGRALRYGALPLLPMNAGGADWMVEWDTASATGNALLYRGFEGGDIDAVVARVSALKSDPSGWAKLGARLLATAPTWKRTAALLDTLRTAAVEEADLQAIAD